MNDSDYTMYNVSSFLSRSKHVDWKKSVISRATVLMRFLKSHEMLIGVEPFEENGELKLDTIIRESSLSEKGKAFFEKAWPSWVSYLDRGGDVNNIAWLEKKCKKEGIL